MKDKRIRDAEEVKEQAAAVLKQILEMK